MSEGPYCHAYTSCILSVIKCVCIPSPPPLPVLTFWSSEFKSRFLPPPLPPSSFDLLLFWSSEFKSRFLSPYGLYVYSSLTLNKQYPSQIYALCFLLTDLSTVLHIINPPPTPTSLPFFLKILFYYLAGIPVFFS